MAISVSTANYQAGQLASYSDQLRNTRRQLVNYKQTLNSNWLSQEVPYIIRGLEQSIAQIDRLIQELDSIGNDIKRTANEIRQEEEAARQRRIQQAQAQFDDACRTLDSLAQQRNNLEDVFRSNPHLRFLPQYIQHVQILESQIRSTQEQVAACQRALDAARR